MVFDGSVERYGLSLNSEILQTKAKFSLGEREDFHERKSKFKGRIFHVEFLRCPWLP